MQYLALQYPEEDPRAIVDLVQRSFAYYDFVGVTERMDESLVAFASTARIPLGDVLYARGALLSGNYDVLQNIRDRCSFVARSFVDDEMKEFFLSREWQDLVKWDRLFYVLANRSLDLTIASLPDFDAKLAQYRHAMELVETECPPLVLCTANGTFLPDEPVEYFGENILRHTCLHDLARRLNMDTVV